MPRITCKTSELNKHAQGIYGNKCRYPRDYLILKFFKFKLLNFRVNYKILNVNFKLNF